MTEQSSPPPNEAPMEVSYLNLFVVVRVATTMFKGVQTPAKTVT